MSENLGFSRGGVDESREHLDECGLAGAVGSDEAEDLPFLDIKGGSGDGLFLDPVAPKERSHRCCESRFFPVDPEHLSQVSDLDHQSSLSCLRAYMGLDWA